MGSNTVYNLLLNSSALLFSPILLPWILLSEKRRKTINQRLWLGKNTSERNRAPSTVRPIWVHALSVGEMLSAVPLVLKLPGEFPGRPVVVTASTRTGYDIARNRLENKVDQIRFFPHDFRFSVRRAAAAINPALVVIVETDLWPNYLTHMKRHNVPVVLANGRLSQSTFQGYRRFSFFMGRPISSLAAICAQSTEDGRRFEALGIPAEKIHITGNLKFDRDSESDEANGPAALPRDKYFSPDEKVLVAGSTHPGEEAILLKTFIRLKNRHPYLRMIIAPRDPRRAEGILRMIRAADISTSLLNEIPPPDPLQPDSVVVLGRMGLLGHIYTLADFAFVGGSLVSCGGHNPLEAAALGKPVLFGRDMSDFRAIAAALETAGGAIRLDNEEALYAVLENLLGNKVKALEMGQRALYTFRENGGAGKKTLAVIGRFLVPI